VDRLVKILQTNNIIPNYIDTKHFDVRFPENHNIKFQNNMCYIRKQDKWQPIGIDRLSAVLLQTNSNELAKKYNDTREIFENIIQNVDMIEYIEKRFNYLDLMTNKNRYKETLDDIKNLIKTK
jgi:ribosomal protein S19E (S16A)